ncbi:PaaI family thioesterase [Ideonella sp.]|uniref:PaaI family thioesterase n=1 Tax=Ideonella sp. TaxID=1929293 RepID=UPI0035ADE56F
MSDSGFNTELFLQLGREVLDQQPFSRLLGAELTHLRPGDAVLELALKDELKQQNGFAHGGVVSYLADNALTYAGGTAMRVPVVTSEFKINYVRPAQGERLIARAKAVSVGKSQSVCRCEVFAVLGHEETLCALAQGTITKMGDAPPG